MKYHMKDSHLSKQNLRAISKQIVPWSRLAFLLLCAVFEQLLMVNFYKDITRCFRNELDQNNATTVLFVSSLIFVFDTKEKMTILMIKEVQMSFLFSDVNESIQEQNRSEQKNPKFSNESWNECFNKKRSSQNVSGTGTGYLTYYHFNPTYIPSKPLIR